MEKVRAVCQNCANYDRKSKKCLKQGDYVARKNSCSEFKATNA